MKSHNKNLVLFVIWIFMAIAIAVLLVISTLGIRLTPSDNVVESHVLLLSEDNIQNELKAMFRKQHAMAKNACKEGMYVGDSLTEGLSLYGYVPKKQVIAKSGIMVQMMRTHIDDIVKDRSSVIFFMLGMNDLNHEYLTISQSVKEYETLLKEVRNTLPASDLYVQSLLPVTSKYEKKNRITNKRINEYNKSLQKMVRKLEDKRIHYIDLSAKYKTKKGKLSKDKTLDGYHLTKEAYKVWLNEIVTQMERQNLEE